MDSFEKSLKQHLSSKPSKKVSKANQQLLQQALQSANHHQATKDVAALGFASLWVVLASLFTSILKPILLKSNQTIHSANRGKKSNGYSSDN